MKKQLRICDYCKEYDSTICVTFITKEKLVDSFHVCGLHADIGEMFNNTAEREKATTVMMVQSPHGTGLCYKNKFAVY